MHFRYVRCASGALGGASGWPGGRGRRIGGDERLSQARRQGVGGGGRHAHTRGGDGYVGRGDCVPALVVETGTLAETGGTPALAMKTDNTSAERVETYVHPSRADASNLATRACGGRRPSSTPRKRTHNMSYKPIGRPLSPRVPSCTKSCTRSAPAKSVSGTKTTLRNENDPKTLGLRVVSLLVAGKGIEPLTRGFSVPCSTN